MPLEFHRRRLIFVPYTDVWDEVTFLISMGQNSYWENDSQLAGQEILRHLWNKSLYVRHAVTGYPLIL
jgi:hypothetical protein